MQKDIAEFFRKIKDLGYLAKLDTNGTNPDVIKRFVNEKLVDYIAMDIKSPLNKYEQTVCRSIDIGKISESIEFIMSCGVEYEFRTTVVRSQLDILDFENIGKTLKGAKDTICKNSNLTLLLILIFRKNRHIPIWNLRRYKVF